MPLPIRDFRVSNKGLESGIGWDSGPPDPELLRIRDIVYQTAGIFLPDGKFPLLIDRCARRMKILKASTLREYVNRLTASYVRQAELTALLNEITIGETCFFRNPPQLDALRQVVLPGILKARAKSQIRRLRIWSAGCSTGEEPYTLRMLLLEEARSMLKDWSFEILATDLNERSLAHAQAAVYGAHSMRRLTPYHTEKYFTSARDQFQLRPVVRSGVNFSRLNLTDDARMSFMKGLDLIFCCNVLIYFDLTSKRRVIEHFHNTLLPHGYLFLGPSESLYRLSDDFQLVHLPKTTAYIKRPHLHARKKET